nr:MAG TPA_asm: hypothetical protein [Caudoviricetes sp.]
MVLRNTLKRMMYLKGNLLTNLLPSRIMRTLQNSLSVFKVLMQILKNITVS